MMRSGRCFYLQLEVRGKHTRVVVVSAYVHPKHSIAKIDPVLCVEIVQSATNINPNPRKVLCYTVYFCF